jgi:AcrR family transcriptional regulator
LLPARVAICADPRPDRVFNGAVGSSHLPDGDDGSRGTGGHTGGDQQMTRAAERRTAGRPRDPTIDARMVDAALKVYAAHGWAGFTIKAVAAEGGFSRDSIGRRFATRTDLLIEALAASGLPAVEYTQGQSLDTWLLDMAQRVFSIFVHERGRAHLRLHLDADLVPDLFRAYRQRVMDPALSVLRDRFAKMAESAGCRDVDPIIVLENVIGSALVHALLNQDVDVDDHDVMAEEWAHLAAIVERALRTEHPAETGSRSVAGPAIS